MEPIFNIEELVSSIHVPEKPKVNYWIVRAGKGSAFFNEFTLNEEVALDWQYKDDTNSELNDINDIKEFIIKEGYPSKTSTQAAKKIDYFINKMQIGDIVLTPSGGKRKVAFGIIKSDVIFNNDLTFKSRRKVNWIHTLPKNDIEPKLQIALNQPHSIFTLTPYLEDMIDTHLWSFFNREELSTLTFNVKGKKEHGIDLIEFQNNLINCLNIYETATLLKLDISDFSIKVRVQSDGKISLTGKKINMKIIYTIVVLLTGGSLVYKGLSLKSDGFIKGISNLYEKHIEHSEYELKEKYKHEEVMLKEKNKHEIAMKKLEILEASLKKNVEALEIEIPEIIVDAEVVE